MRRRIHLWFHALLVSGLLLTGCRTGSESEENRGSKALGESFGRRKAEEANNGGQTAAAEAHAHYGAAVIHELNNEMDAALDEFYQAALKDPGNETLTIEIASRLLRKERFQEALDLLESAAKRRKASGEIYAQLGLAYARLGRYADAVAANQAAIKKSPRSLASYRNLYSNYLQSNQTTEALRVLDRAAKQSGADAGFLVGLAGLYANFAQQFPSQRQTVKAKALAVLERAERLKPSATHLKLQLADGFFLAGDLDKAAGLYLGVVEELEDMPQARDLVRDRLTKIYLREGDRKRAVEQLQALVRDNPSNAQAYYFLGLIAHEERRWADAADYLKKTLLFSPNFEAGYYDLATAQIALGKGDEALATLAIAKSKFPQSFQLEYGLGMANYQVRNFSEAVRHFNTAEFLARTTNTNLLTHFFYYQMGAAFEQEGDHLQARNCFEKCLKLRPGFEQAYYDLANVLIITGQGHEALATLETARKRFTGNFLLEYLTGAAQRQRKNFAEAVEHFLVAESIAQAKETNRLTHFFYFDVGAAFERKGDYKKAETYFGKCLKLKPDFHEAQNYLGYMWAERGEKLGRAQELIEQAVKAQPDNAAYLDSMAWVLFKQHRSKEALEYMLKAAKLSKEPDATLYDHLGDIYADLNDTDRAREAWRKSLAVEKSDTVQKKLDAAGD